MDILEDIKSIVKTDWQNIIKRASLLISVPIINVIYLLLNRYRENTVALKIGLDNLIPFNQYFIVPYVIWYLYVPLFLILLCILDKKMYLRAVLSLNIGMLVCYVIFFFFPTCVERPVILTTDVFSKLVCLIYSRDNPYNCFPSIHVLNTLVVNIFICISDKISFSLKFWCTAIGISIILSTMFIKQHYFMDVVGGVIVSIVVCFAFSKTNFHNKI